ncbi:MAG: type II secretion system F family protein [Acidipropionibacterium acidipropionici]|nr:type II secretion system F family protein [Acidipropionibacterium acidipropionici]
MGMNAFGAALLAAMITGGMAMVVIGAIPRPRKLSTGMSTGLWTRVDKSWRTAPRAARIRWITGVAGGVVCYLITGWPIGLILVPAVLIGLPPLLADPPETELEKLRGLERWVRLVAGSSTTGKSVVDAIRATRGQAPEVLAEPLAALVSRLDSRWGPRPALQRFADDLDSADADQVVAAVVIAAERGGTGASATLGALAGSLQERARAMREIATERAKPRIVVRQVTAVIGVVLGAAIIVGRDFFAPYSSLLGQLLLCLYAAAYAGALVVLARRSRPRHRERILVRAAVGPAPRSLGGRGSGPHGGPGHTEEVGDA